MVVRIGKDNTIHINDDVLKVICQTLRKYHYETGGIIGTNEKGVITAFQFDETDSSNIFEYCPNIDFLNKIINIDWLENDIQFFGFVHSHLNNDVLSTQDTIYAKNILKENSCLDEILIGILNLKSAGNIKWYLISK